MSGGGGVGHLDGAARDEAVGPRAHRRVAGADRSESHAPLRAGRAFDGKRRDTRLRERHARVRDRLGVVARTVGDGHGHPPSRAQAQLDRFFLAARERHAELDGRHEVPRRRPQRVRPGREPREPYVPRPIGLRGSRGPQRRARREHARARHRVARRIHDAHVDRPEPPRHERHRLAVARGARRRLLVARRARGHAPGARPQPPHDDEAVDPRARADRQRIAARRDLDRGARQRLAQLVAHRYVDRVLGQKLHDDRPRALVHDQPAARARAWPGASARIQASPRGRPSPGAPCPRRPGSCARVGLERALVHQGERLHARAFERRAVLAVANRHVEVAAAVRPPHGAGGTAPPARGAISGAATRAIPRPRRRRRSRPRRRGARASPPPVA